MRWVAPLPSDMCTLIGTVFREALTELRSQDEDLALLLESIPTD
jgi:hypothetical protein